MAINVGLLAVGAAALFLLSKMGRGDSAAPADAVQSRLGDPEFFATLGGLVQDPVTPEPDEGEFFFRFDALDFGDFGADPFPFISEENAGTIFDEGGFFSDPVPSGDVTDAAESRSAAEAAADAADLPRQRQFYIDDLVGRLEVPASFFGGAIAGATVEEVVLNYNTIYEDYLAQLKLQAGAEAQAAMLAALQADLVAQLRDQGVAGTPVGGSEDALQASAQGLIDQHLQALRAQAAMNQAAALAAQEAAALEQQRLAEVATRVETAVQESAFEFEESGFFFQPTPSLGDQPFITPQADLVAQFEERRAESGIEFFGTFDFDPDEF